VSVRFRPKGSVVGDVMPFYENRNGEYHIFYLRGYEGDRLSRWQLRCSHIKSRDLLNWQEMPDALDIGDRSSPDGGAVSTGSIILGKDNEWHFFYVGYNPENPRGKEQILHATSRDGILFKKDGELTVIDPDNRNYLAGGDWRDPYVFWDADQKEYCMTITANSPEAVCRERAGVVGIAKSDNLKTWVLDKPIYVPNNYPALECTEVFKIGKQWYMIFSQFGGYTEYRISNSLYGPWSRPKNPILDRGASFFYAARTLFDGKRRLLFGWCGTEKDNIDSEFGQWGGDLVSAREIMQGKNGELYLMCPIELRKDFTPLDDSIFPLIGNWAKEDRRKIRCVFTPGFSACLFKGSHSRGIMALNLKSDRNSGKGGVLLNAYDDLSRCYYISYDFGLKLLEIIKFKFERQDVDSLPRLTKTIAYQILEHKEDQEEAIELRIFHDSDIIEVFANNQAVITARVGEIGGKRIGLFAEDAEVVFGDMELG